MSGLVQLGSKLFAHPSDVRKVYETDAFECAGKTYEGHVYVVFDGIYRTTDWPLDRVMRALGLTDKTWLHNIWEGLE